MSADFDVAPEGVPVAIDATLVKSRKDRGNCAACTDDVVAGDRYGLIADGSRRILCESCWTAAEWHNRQLAEAPVDNVVRTFNGEPVTADELAERVVVKPPERDDEAVVAEVTEDMTARAEAKAAEPEVDPVVAAFIAAGLLVDAPDVKVEEAAAVARAEFTNAATRQFCPGCQGRGWNGEVANSCPACSGTGKRRDESAPAWTGTAEANKVGAAIADGFEAGLEQVPANVRPGFPEGSIWNDPEKSARSLENRAKMATEGLLDRRRRAAAAHVDDADMFGYATPEAAPKRTWTDPETGYVYTQQSANRWTGMDSAGLELEAITGDEIVRREAAAKSEGDADPWFGLNPDLEYVDPSGNAWRAVAVGQWLYSDPSGTEWQMNSRELSNLAHRAVVDAERPKPKMPLPPPPPPRAPLPAPAKLPLPPPPPVRASLPLPPPPPAPASSGVDFGAMVREARVRDLLAFAIGYDAIAKGMGVDHGALLDMLAPYQGASPTLALNHARKMIEAAIVNHPRSQQKTIGPSELGTECEHCLAAKLAGWEQKAEIAWLPTVGTAVHAWIEQSVLDLQKGKPSSQRRYLTEARVVVGQVDGDDVEGSTDLVDLVAGMTVDWKVVGKTTLTKARSGPSRTYRAQQHLYARGWNHAGVKVGHVAIAYLPRNELSLNSAIWWHEPYDEAFADEVLAHASEVRRRIRALETVGDDAVDAWIQSLPRAKACRDCERYGDFPKAVERDYTPGDSLAGILP